jgi:hypothetical protein
VDRRRRLDSRTRQEGYRSDFRLRTLVESTIIAIAVDDPVHLGVLSSRPHLLWALSIGSRLGIGNDPRYNNSSCFDTYPFPAGSDTDRQVIGEIAERLDAHRKRQLANDPELILTDIYNVIDKMRAGEPLTPVERDIHARSLASVLLDLHNRLDAAVFAAYGWPPTLTDDEILARLVALNAERAAEEAQGIVRWLRPEFQNPTGRQATTQATFLDEEASPEATASPKAKLPWPKTLSEQTQAVRSALAARRSPVTPDELSRTFARARVPLVAELLATLSALGLARQLPDGRFVPPAPNR